MDVLKTAATIGLTGPGGTVGAIEEDVVLMALSELAVAHADDATLFEDASLRVRLSRSAGVERIEPDSVFAAGHPSLIIQMRYRAEMLDVFTDLAIDLGMRLASRVGSPVA